jgi:uncharacterized protein (DUF2336 family)
LRPAVAIVTLHPTIFSDIDRLIEGSAGRRAAVLVQVTDLFIEGAAQFSEDAIGLFDDVICRLVQEIESSVRILLAQRIAPVAQAPINLSRMLAGDDDIRVAEPILIQSERLDSVALVGVVRTKSQAHLLAIARRKTLTEAVTDVLVERGDQEVLLCAANNVGARFSKPGFSMLVSRSAGNDVLTECVGSRTDIPKDLLLTLISAASEIVRSKLIAEHPSFRKHINHAVQAVTEDLKTSAATTKDHSQAQLAMKLLSEKGKLAETTIGALIENDQPREAAAAIAQLCGVPIEVVERAFAEDQPETILVLAKAASLTWPTAKALLSLRAGDRALSPTRMSRSMASFERLNFATARQILEFYKTRRATPALH